MKTITLGAAAVIALSLGLVACGTSAPGLTAPDPAGLTNQVGGTIGGWTAGSATIEAQAIPDPADQTKNVTLSSGTVNADGSFNLTLPTPEAVTPYLNTYQQTPRAGCTGVFTQSVKTGRTFAMGSFALRKSDGSYIGYLIQNSPDAGNTLKAGDYYIIRIYADQAFTVTGTLNCPDKKITLNLNLKQGWNAAVNSVHSVDADGKILSNTISTVAKLPTTKF